MPAQQYLLETLGIEPAAEGEAVGPVRRSQDERWNTNLAAARQFHTREGHCAAGEPRADEVHITVDGDPGEIKVAALPRAAAHRRVRGNQGTLGTLATISAQSDVPVARAEAGGQCP
jgi:hypothetical protein